MEDINNAISGNQQQQLHQQSTTIITGKGTTVTQVESQIVDDFEPDPKWEITTLEKASYDCGDVVDNIVELGGCQQFVQTLEQQQQEQEQQEQLQLQQQEQQQLQHQTQEQQFQHVSEHQSENEGEVEEETDKDAENIHQEQPQPEQIQPEQQQPEQPQQIQDQQPQHLTVTENENKEEVDEEVENDVEISPEERPQQVQDQQPQHIFGNQNEGEEKDNAGKDNGVENIQQEQPQPEKQSQQLELAAEYRAEDGGEVDEEKEKEVKNIQLELTGQSEMIAETSNQNITGQLNEQAEEPNSDIVSEELAQSPEKARQSSDLKSTLSSMPEALGSHTKQEVGSPEIEQPPPGIVPTKSDSTSDNAEVANVPPKETTNEIEEPSTPRKPVRAVRATRTPAALPKIKLEKKPAKRPLSRDDSPEKPQPKLRVPPTTRPASSRVTIKLEKKPAKRPLLEDDSPQKSQPKKKPPTARSASSRVTISTSAPAIKPDYSKRASSAHIDDIGSKKFYCEQCKKFSTDRLNNIVHHKLISCPHTQQYHEARVEEYKQKLQSPKSNNKRTSR